MHTSWIGVMLGLFPMLLVSPNTVNGKAFLENVPNEGNQNYYSEIRTRYPPMYDQNYAANPKLFYTPQIDGQRIYVPEISGSEHVNKFLDDYYKINRDNTQSWTLAPPVTYDYDITSENGYYENGVTANSMVKNFLEEKYNDGTYTSYILPATPKSSPKPTDNKKGMEHKNPSNKKTHIRKKKRPHGTSTESSYKEDKPNKSEMDYSKGVKIKVEKPNMKEKKDQSVKHKNKSNEHISKSYEEDYVTNFPNLKFPNKEKTKTSTYSTNKIKNQASVGKKKPEVDEINKLSDDYEPEIVDVINADDYQPEVVSVVNADDYQPEVVSVFNADDYQPEVVSVFNADDYQPEVVDVVNEDDYQPEVVDVVNKLSDQDYEPEIVDADKRSNDYQQDVEVIKVPQTKKHFETSTEDDDESTDHKFSSKKDKNKKDKNKIKNSSVYSKVKTEKPKGGKHQSDKASNKPNKHHVKDVKHYKPENIVKSPKDNSKKTENKKPVSYETGVADGVNKLSDDDYELEAGDEVELSDDYEPEILDVVNKLSDDDLETADADELSDIDDVDVDIINEEKNLDTPDAVLNTLTSEKEKTKPSKPVKTKPSKPVKGKPSKPVKTTDHSKNTDKYNEYEIKSTDTKKIQPPKTKTKVESKQKYESDGHIVKGKDQDALADESIIGNQTDDLKEMHSRDLLNQPTDIRDEVEEFDGSGSQAVDTSARRFPQFFKNIESIRNLTSLNSNIWSLIFNPNPERNELKSCVTRSNESGICMYVQQCEVPNIATSLEQLLRNACVIDDMFIGVCCPEFPVQTVKVHWDEMPSNFDKQTEDEFGHNADDCGMRSDDAKKTESWPWQAPLVSMSNGKIFCGGIIINDDYILTAAHCTTKIPKNQILVRLGQHDETSGDDYAVVEIKRHAQYNPRTLHNDIALLKLGRRIVRDTHTDAVCLPEDDDDDDDHEDEKALLLGRKGSFSQNPKQAEWLKVMSNSDCGKKLGSKVPATLLCTDARDENERTCNLDSGAPLVVEDDGKYEVIGILSWNRNDCDERFPATFSRVSKYVRWIQKHAV